MRGAFLLLCLMGCDRVFLITPVAPATDAHAPDGAAISCVFEPFTGMYDVDAFEVLDPNSVVTVGVESDQLVIRPAINNPNFNALITTNKYDLTEAFVHVQVASAIDGPVGDTLLKVAPLEASGNEALIFYNNGNLGFRRESVALGRDEIGIPYSSTTHAYWRIRFSGSAVYFETSASGTDGAWIERHMSTVDFPIDDLFVSLVGGTYGAGTPAPGQATFDDLTICPHQTL